MRVAVVGGESTGGRLLTRLLQVDEILDVQHWSLPHGPRNGRGPFWPILQLADFRPDYVFVTVRGWEPTLASKMAYHQPDLILAEQEIRTGYQKLFTYLGNAEKSWRFIVYEYLVAYPQTAMQGCWNCLNRPCRPISEDIYNADQAWEEG